MSSTVPSGVAGAAAEQLGASVAQPWAARVDGARGEQIRAAGEQDK